MSHKASLELRLAEPVTFPKHKDITGHRFDQDASPSILRAVLILRLSKPMKVSSIDVEFSGRTSTYWPEEVAARRMQFFEEHTLLSMSTSFFRFNSPAAPGKDTPQTAATIPPGGGRHIQPARGDRHERRTTTERTGHGNNDPVLLPDDSQADWRGQRLMIPSMLYRDDNQHDEHFSDTRSETSLSWDIIGPRSPTSSLHSPASDRHGLSDRSEESSHAMNSRMTAAVLPTQLLRLHMHMTPKALVGAMKNSVLRYPSRNCAVSCEHSAAGNPSWHEETPTAQKGAGWYGMDAGTYEFPVTFAVPPNVPPSLKCEYGQVNWTLDATVHRPGTFRQKIAASRDVVLVSSPAEDNTEPSDVTIERQWEEQMQYFITLSGRYFRIGGPLDFDLTMMPLAKARVYGIGVALEETVQYHTDMRAVEHTSLVKRTTLLDIQDHPEGMLQLLPMPEGTDAQSSPLRPHYVGTDSSALMGPGPWKFHFDLRVPPSCKDIHFTNQNKWSNITVTHQLAFTLRAQREHETRRDDKSGQLKRYEIITRTPVHILSCRCQPEHLSLPGYHVRLDDDFLPIGSQSVQTCPCERRTSTESMSGQAATAEWPQNGEESHPPLSILDEDDQGPERSRRSPGEIDPPPAYVE